MKKKILFTILCLFSFLAVVDAKNNIMVSNVSAEYQINANGSANIKEEWFLNKKEISTIYREFKTDKTVKLHNLKITSSSCGVYKEGKSSNKCEYDYTNRFGKTKLTINSDDDLVISYTIDNFVAKFNDSYGLSYDLFNNSKIYGINNIDLKFKSEYEFNEFNVNLLVSSSGTIEKEINSGEINIRVNKLTKNSKLSILFNLSNLKYNTKRVTNTTYSDEKLAFINNKYTSKYILSHFLTAEVRKVIILIVIIFVMFVIITKLVKNKHRIDEYAGIKSFNGVNKINYNEVDICTSIPCNGDLYQIAFIAGYYGLIKNRSDLIGALLLKFQIDGIVQIKNNEGNYYISVLPNQYLPRKLDKDLYDILLSSSNSNLLKGNKFINYTKEHYLRVMTWFNMGFNESINNLCNSNGIKKAKKGKKLILTLEENAYNTAIEIAGIKKFLINFNQTKLDRPLDDYTYQYMILIAELFGIGEQVAKEILRKNPDDYYAKLLLNLELNKELYKSCYQSALEPYRKVVKNRKRTGYNPELENILKQQEKQEERKSVF